MYISRTMGSYNDGNSYILSYLLYCHVCMLLFGCAVEDWDLFEKMMDHLYERHIKSESELHPVLFSEASVSRCP